ncbi:ATP-binding protein [Massilia aerilata]|uniref:histidine kinase n=1 Tax=Massilia aerilata TaxID=453817 RepID=A0ABW0S5A6_9BURK
MPEPFPLEFAPLHHLLTVSVRSELDVIASRLRARQITNLCAFGHHEQTRIATAVSELARNALVYAAGGKVRFFIGRLGSRQALVVTIDDQGAGIATLDRILGEDGASHGVKSGGIPAARRLMDRCDIDSGSHGTHIVLVKAFAAQAPVLDAGAIDTALSQLGELPSNVALSEAHQQNRELTDALAALQAKQAELLEMSARLEATNRQVEALNVLLNEKAQSLVSADRRKDEFLSILSHELRSPLSAVSMAAHLLESSPDNPSQGVRLGQLIKRQTGHMSRMVEDLLDVSRVSRGLVSISRAPVGMREVVDAAFEQHAPAARAKGHTVSQPDALQDWTVEGDRTRLVQIVANLLGNAIRYTPDGGRIELSMQSDDGWLLMRVSDNGIGIPPDLMPHLFDLYTQAERSSDSKNSGLGLGLALVKSLVEAHGGSVSASSGGHGSQFEVRLKLAGQQP